MLCTVSKIIIIYNHNILISLAHLSLTKAQLYEKDIGRGNRISMLIFAQSLGQNTFTTIICRFR